MPDDGLVHDPDGGLPRLVAIMARLRDPEAGCPWDLEQTFDTIAPYTIEEAYEVADAIARALDARAARRARRPLAAGGLPRPDGRGGRRLRAAGRHPRGLRQDGAAAPARLRRRAARQDRRAADRRLGADEGGRARRAAGDGRGARRRRRRAAGADPRGQAAGPRGPRRLRLARRRRGARQDRRGDRRARRGARRRRRRPRRRGVRRPDVRHGQPRPPPAARPRGGAAGGQRQVHPPLPGDRGGAGRRRPHAGRLHARRDGRALGRRETRREASDRRRGLRPIDRPGLCRKRAPGAVEGAEACRTQERRHSRRERLHRGGAGAAHRDPPRDADRRADRRPKGRADDGRGLPAPAPPRPAAADRHRRGGLRRRRPRVLRPAPRHQPGGDRRPAPQRVRGPEGRRPLGRLPAARPGGLRDAGTATRTRRSTCRPRRSTA